MTHAFTTLKAAADFTGMNTSTMSKKLKANDGSLSTETFDITKTDEGYTVMDAQPEIVEEIVQEVAEVAEVADTTRDEGAAPYIVETTAVWSRKEAADLAGCSVGRIAELIKLSRDAERGIGKSVKGVFVFVSAVLEDDMKAEAKATRDEVKGADSGTKLEKLTERFEAKAAKYLKLGAELEALCEQINELRGTSDDIHVMMAGI